ncbi:MAG: MFS transporter [Actinomycetota bacterium]
MGIMGVGGAFLSTTPANIVGDVIRGKSGQVIALWQMAGDAGMIIGPLTVGVISDLFSYRTAFAVSAVVFAVSLHWHISWERPANHIYLLKLLNYY